MNDELCDFSILIEMGV